MFAVSRTQSTLDTLKAENPSIQTICADLSDWPTARAKLDVDALDAVDYLVNNAAVMVYGTFLDMTPESIDQ